MNKQFNSLKERLSGLQASSANNSVFDREIENMQEVLDNLNAVHHQVNKLLALAPSEINQKAAKVLDKCIDTITTIHLQNSLQAEVHSSSNSFKT